ncbi:predicted protein [Sparassis crispa]|uniref:Uncharacterized protein n=1 Tax=Sparassis crispa TaxID=139825 RepID=A0A401GQN6_9APHY|nr:predicted protein [Sparassis crispa]GBE84561.1 predicted protein [Sparassis crispa]
MATHSPIDYASHRPTLSNGAQSTTITESGAEKASVDADVKVVGARPSRSMFPSLRFLACVLVVSIYAILLVPYILVSTMLALLTLIEILIRRGLSSDRNVLDRLVFVRLAMHCQRSTMGVVNYVTPASVSECLEEVLLPSLRIKRSPQHQEYVEEGQRMVQEIKEEIVHCRELIKIARDLRRQNLKTWRTAPSSTTSPSEAVQVQEYRRSIQDSERLREHLEALQRDYDELTFLARTQAAADCTGYHGLTEWARKSLDIHRHLMNALCQISFVGAGLTYTTIFSATRGNLGLMCYSWGLFNCGFIIPLSGLSLLKWASTRSRETLFASPQVWSLLLSIFIYLSVIAVAAALCLLNVSIIVLHYSWTADSTPQFNVQPVPAGAFALMCTAITCVLTIFAFFLHYSVNGWHNLFGALLGRQNEEARSQRFREYVPE